MTKVNPERTEESDIYQEPSCTGPEFSLGFLFQQLTVSVALIDGGADPSSVQYGGADVVPMELV